MLTTQMASLPETVAKTLADMLREQLRLGRLNNPVGWLFTMLRRARSGELNLPEAPATARTTETHPVPDATLPVQPANRPSPDAVRAMIEHIRQSVAK